AGGLSANLWAGSTQSAIQALLPQMPVTLGGAALDDLARRVLLTRAQAPEGSPPSGDSLLSIKLARLMAQGDLDAITVLQPNLGTLANDSKAARIVAEADLLLDKQDAALELCETQLKTSSDPFWLKLSALLQTLSGNGARAELALSMARDADAGDQ